MVEPYAGRRTNGRKTLEEKLIGMICALANSLWLGGCLSESARFRRALRRVAEEQQEVLQRVLAQNAGTEFGRGHEFSSIRSVADYQRRVPLRDYDQYREWIGRIAAGVPGVLTSESVGLFEPTSGSAGDAKWIPYTRSLRREFQRGIRPWIANLFLNSPALLAGQAYWSVSPVVAQPQKTSGGIPIGFEDDASYVGGWQRLLVNAVMAVPSQLRLSSHREAFQYITLLFLIRARNLRLISTWNPSFLSLLLDRLPEWGDRLAQDLARGTIWMTDALPRGLDQSLQADPRRSRELRAALATSTPQERHARLWTKLGLISCWAGANAAAPAARLASLFPQAYLQGKGLIATEGFVSLPLLNHEHTVLAVRSHFLEFLPADSTGGADDEHPQLAHELANCAKYEVVVTTGGGLYRYRLGDLIEVTGHLHGCPLIRFLGRQTCVSDWFGEKLNEAHVSYVLQDVFRALGMVPAFAMLACETESAPASYVLYIDSPERDETLDRAARTIDVGLRANFHYDYARRLGQLGRVRGFRAPGAVGAYLDASVKSGQRSGNVKPPALDQRDGWWRVFDGSFLASEHKNQVT